MYTFLFLIFQLAEMSLYEENVIELEEINIYNGIDSKFEKGNEGNEKSIHALTTLNFKPNNTSPKRSRSEDNKRFVETKCASHKKMPQPSETKSNTELYRTKLRQRFQTKKQQARRTRSSLEKYTDDFRTISRLSNIIDKENKIIESELSSYTIKGYKESESRSEFEFFFEDHMNEDGKSVRHTEENTTPNESLKNNYTNLIRSYLPEHLNFQIQISERNLLWIPPNLAPSLESKLSGNEPRFLSEEGLFEEKLPNIPTFQLNILEQRLLNADNIKWFKCDGTLKILKSPLLYKSLRPSKALECLTNGLTDYILPEMNPIELTSVKIKTDNILQIQIECLKFLHHPLFSIEHVLQNRLIMLYTNHKQKTEGKTIERITKKLMVLRNTKTNLKEYLFSENNDKAVKKMNKVITEIANLRELLFQEHKNYRYEIKLILETWKSIKYVRKVNEYSSTSIKLIIQKEKQNYYEDKRAIEEQIQTTYDELQYEYEFKREYHHKLKCLENVDFFNEEDSELTIEEVREKIKECSKPPGEPIINLYLSYEKRNVTENVENNKEKLRRNAIKTTKIFFKLFYGNTEVCKSKVVSLNDLFNCIFNESFYIKTDKIVENIFIEIYEQSNNILKKKIGEINLSIPHPNQVLHLNKNLEVFFEKKENVHCKHSGVGSGEKMEYYLKKYNLSLNDIPEINLFTSGSITYSIGWDIKRTTTDYSLSTLNDHSAKPIEYFDINDVIEWSKQCKKDPQDPKSSNFNEYSENQVGLDHDKQKMKKGFFSQSFDMKSLTFCTSNEIEENLRYRLLQLRDRNVPEFCGLTVPNCEREIPKHLISDYEKRISYENLYQSLQPKDDVNKTRTEGRKALKQIYFAVFQKCRNSEKNLLYEDVVNEVFLRQIESSIRNTLFNIVSWFTFRATPNISFPATSHVQKTDNSNMNFELKTPLKLYVTVVSAINTPKRIQNRIHKLRASPRDLNSTNKETVKLSVDVRYKNIHVTTSAVKGPNPIWNETLQLEVESLNVDCLNPDSLTGSISLHLFDHIDKNDYNTEERVWLGSTEVSISAICYSTKMEGLFQLQMPTILFGYEPIKENEKINSFHYKTSLSLLIRAEPQLPKITPCMEELPTNEIPYIKDYILKWNEAYNKNFPHRKFSALAVDIKCRTTCVTRFIKPIDLPQLNSGHLELTPDEYAKYFSLFPFTDFNKFYQNIWLTSQQFLKMMTGSIIDHAVTLTCCLLSLDLQVWLLLGCGIPHGVCAYVLVKKYPRELEFPQFYIYDVVTGLKYYTNDKLCPLQKVYCLINKHNVWANIQRTDDLQNTHFDVSKKSDWLALFTNDIMEAVPSVQQKVKYTSASDVHKLESNLERKLRKKITKSRRLDRTKWNTSLSRALKKLVVRCENASIHDGLSLEIMQDIMKLQLSRKIKGFVINKTYNNFKTILEFIENTDILLHEGINTEYVLFTHLVSYPNQIVNVWLLVALIS